MLPRPVAARYLQGSIISIACGKCSIPVVPTAGLITASDPTETPSVLSACAFDRSELLLAFFSIVFSEGPRMEMFFVPAIGIWFAGSGSNLAPSTAPNSRIHWSREVAKRPDIVEAGYKEMTRAELTFCFEKTSTAAWKSP